MKIFIIGHSNINLLNIGLAIQNINDDLSISPAFTSNEDDIVNPYIYYLDKETINISYKNNALLYVYTDDNESTGITYDDYYNNNIFCLNIHSFNIIPDSVFQGSDFIIIWVDYSYPKPTMEDIYDTSYVEERLMSFNYLYFCNEDVDVIAEVVNRYIYADEENREIILNEYE